MIVVGVTGSINSGKTTLVNDLSKEFGYECYVVNEVASELYRELGTSFKDMFKTPKYLEFEHEVLKRQIEAERKAKSSGKNIVLIDRTVYDWLYYFIMCGRYYEDDTDMSSLAIKSINMYKNYIRSNTYDLLILCSPVNNGIKESIQYNILSSLIKFTPIPKLYLKTKSRVDRINEAKKFILEHLK